MLLQYSTALGY